jgi:hypothetical protein
MILLRMTSSRLSEAGFFSFSSSCAGLRLLRRDDRLEFFCCSAALSFALGEQSVQRLVVFFLELLELRPALFDAFVFFDELVDVDAEVLGHLLHLGRHLVVAARLHDAFDELLLQLVEVLHVALQLALAGLDVIFEFLEVSLELLELLSLILEVFALFFHELPLFFGFALLPFEVFLHLLLVLDEVFDVLRQFVAVFPQLDVRFFEALVQVRCLLVFAVQTIFGRFKVVDSLLEVCFFSVEFLFALGQLIAQLFVFLGDLLLLTLELSLSLLKLSQLPLSFSFVHVGFGPGVDNVASLGYQVVLHVIQLGCILGQVAALLV